MKFYTQQKHYLQLTYHANERKKICQFLPKICTQFQPIPWPDCSSSVILLTDLENVSQIIYITSTISQILILSFFQTKRSLKRKNKLDFTSQGSLLVNVLKVLYTGRVILFVSSKLWILIISIFRWVNPKSGMCTNLS